MNILEKLDDLELNVGPLSIRGKQFLIIGGVIILVAGGFAGKSIMEKRNAAEAQRQQEEQAAQLEAFSVKGPVALSAEQLVDGNYYIKDGDKFYLLPQAYLSSDLDDDTLIPAEANPGRLAVLPMAQAASVPTLYNDTELIFYNAGNSVSLTDEETGEQTAMPSDYWLERFKDQGYTIGFLRLSEDKSGKIHLKTSNGGHTAPAPSSATNLDLENNQDIIVDAIGGKKLTSENLSPSGTVLGLVKDQTYKTDIYSGTNYIGDEYTADVQALTSYELFEVTDYSLGDGYTIVTFPKNLQSGYYYVNGMGMFKYVNGNKADGDAGADYNIPYYIKDENGNVAENPFTSSENQSTEEPGTTDDKKSNDEWSFNISIDNQQAELNVVVTYTEAVKSYFDNVSTPTAVLVSPKGEETNLVNAEGRLMSVNLKDPMIGTWTLKMQGMENKTFSVDTSFAGNTSNMVVKNTDNNAEMTVYLDKDLVDGVITFDWTDKNHAGTFKFEGLDDKKVSFSSEKEDIVVDATYGHMNLAVGELPKGEYKVTVIGESMGTVYFSYEDKADSEGDPEDSEAAEEETEDASKEATDGNADSNKSSK